MAVYDTEPVVPSQAERGTPQPTRALTTALPRSPWYRRREALLIGTAAVLLFFVAWHLVTVARIWSPLLLPGPLDTLQAFRELAEQEDMAMNLAVSAQEFIVGYLLASIVGIPLGLLLGWYPRARYGLDPFITFFYATPRIVLLPLFIIWFGIGAESKIAVVFLGAFFAVVINTTAGIRNLDTSLLRVARSFGAGDLHIFRTIALPGSVPFILTGLRLGIGHALIGVVVGEQVAAQFGVGKIMSIAGQTLQTPKVFAGLFVIATAGMLMTFVLQRLERHFDAWRPQR